MCKINSQCISCILDKHLNKYPENISEAQKLNYIKGVLKIISECDNNISPPEIIAKITEHKSNLFGFSDDYSAVKIYFNKLMLSNENFYRNKINTSDNPLKTALKFALLGNYIDFGALDSIDENKLLEIPNNADNQQVDETEYKKLLNELENAENLVYLTDNCGEIVLDKLFIEKIKAAYPKLNITVIVKGGPVLNDATMEDAAATGLENTATVTDNGCSIAGTPLGKISAKAKCLIDNADLIIAKGQANFETLNGCGKNIFYIFLCKCNLYCRRFNVPQFTGMLLSEKSIAKH